MSGLASIQLRHRRHALNRQARPSCWVHPGGTSSVHLASTSWSPSTSTPARSASRRPYIRSSRASARPRSVIATSTGSWWIVRRPASAKSRYHSRSASVQTMRTAGPAGAPEDRPGGAHGEVEVLVDGVGRDHGVHGRTVDARPGLGVPAVHECLVRHVPRPEPGGAATVGVRRPAHLGGGSVAALRHERVGAGRGPRREPGIALGRQVEIGGPAEVGRGSVLDDLGDEMVRARDVAGHAVHAPAVGPRHLAAGVRPVGIQDAGGLVLDDSDVVDRHGSSSSVPPTPTASPLAQLRLGERDRVYVPAGAGCSSSSGWAVRRWAPQSSSSAAINRAASRLRSVVLSFSPLDVWVRSSSSTIRTRFGTL